MFVFELKGVCPALDFCFPKRSRNLHAHESHPGLTASRSPTLRQLIAQVFSYRVEGTLLDTVAIGAGSDTENRSIFPSFFTCMHASTLYCAKAGQIHSCSLQPAHRGGWMCTAIQRRAKKRLEKKNACRQASSLLTNSRLATPAKAHSFRSFHLYGNFLVSPNARPATKTQP